MLLFSLDRERERVERADISTTIKRKTNHMSNRDTAPDNRASNALSVNNCRMSLPLLAPRERRTPVSSAVQQNELVEGWLGSHRR